MTFDKKKYMKSFKWYGAVPTTFINVNYVVKTHSQ